MPPSIPSANLPPIPSPISKFSKALLREDANFLVTGAKVKPPISAAVFLKFSTVLFNVALTVLFNSSFLRMASSVAVAEIPKALL